MTEQVSTFSDAQFLELSREWAAVNAEIARRRREAATMVASVWDEAIPMLAAESQRLVAQGDWQRGHEDLFTIVGLERNEVRHSAVMAWLLDPLGRHGLGSTMLDAIIEECFPSQRHAVRGMTTVTCEVARGDTRADIVVWSRDFTLIIENKVDAVEGIRQCDRIYQRFGDDPNPLFLFVTPRGRRPKTATGDAADAFATLSLRRFRLMLEAILAAQPSADSVARTTVVNYLRTLQKEFP